MDERGARTRVGGVVEPRYFPLYINTGLVRTATPRDQCTRQGWSEDTDTRQCVLSSHLSRPPRYAAHLSTSRSIRNFPIHSCDIDCFGTGVIESDRDRVVSFFRTHPANRVRAVKFVCTVPERTMRLYRRQQDVLHQGHTVAYASCIGRSRQLAASVRDEGPITGERH